MQQRVMNGPQAMRTYKIYVDQNINTVIKNVKIVYNTWVQTLLNK